MVASHSDWSVWRSDGTEVKAGPRGGAEGAFGAAREARQRAGEKTRIRREDSLTGLDRNQVLLADDLARDRVARVVVPEVFEHEFPLVDVPRFRRQNRLQRRLPRDCHVVPVSLAVSHTPSRTHLNKTATSSNANSPTSNANFNFPHRFRYFSRSCALAALRYANPSL